MSLLALALVLCAFQSCSYLGEQAAATKENNRLLQVLIKKVPSQP